MIKESITENRVNRLEKKIKRLENGRTTTYIILVLIILIQIYDIFKK